MNESEYERLRSLLQTALPPIGEQEPGEDLWPRMLRRLDNQPGRIPWLDLALGSLAVAGLIVFPNMIPWVLMQC